MAFGIPYALQKESFPLEENTNLSEVVALAKTTAKELGWIITNEYNNGFTADTGFMAKKGLSMSDFGQHVMVKVEKGNLHIRSQSEPLHFFDRGRNRLNILSFSEKYKELSANAPEVVDGAEEVGTLHFPGEEETDIFTIESENRRRVIAMPILVAINVIVFILMLVNGVSLLKPDSEVLLKWGANFRPEILQGAYWRLLTSCFLHIGIFHLVMNMYGLIYVGRLLEPLMGYAKFTWAYLLSGIVASMASMYWHEFTVSAGASGAIFGMFGVFLALITTKLISKEKRKPILTNMAGFLGYNLLIGTSQGVDNAAHIGGLLSGVLIGYVWYIGFNKTNRSEQGIIAIAVVSISLMASGYFLLKNLNNDYSEYTLRMERYDKIQADALLPYTIFNTGRTDKYMLEVLEKDGQDNWRKALTLLDSLNELSLPEEVVHYNERLSQYCEFQMDYYDAISNQIKTPGPTQDSLVKEAVIRIETLVALINSESRP